MLKENSLENNKLVPESIKKIILFHNEILNFNMLDSKSNEIKRNFQENTVKLILLESEDNHVYLRLWSTGLIRTIGYQHDDSKLYEWRYYWKNGIDYRSVWHGIFKNKLGHTLQTMHHSSGKINYLNDNPSFYASFEKLARLAYTKSDSKLDFHDYLKTYEMANEQKIKFSII